MTNNIQNETDMRDDGTKPTAKKADGRTREARAARQTSKVARTDTLPNLASKLQSIQERQYETALESADVKAALLEHEGAQARRDSISRKLCGGSTAVTVNDLARWEESLSNAKEVLAQLASRQPILERHPVIATMVARR